MERLDDYYEKPTIGGHKEFPLLDRKPSEYFRSEQCYFACEAEDLTLPAAIQILGEERIIYASDYPHHDYTVNSVQEIRQREDISENAKRKILGENAARFYALK